MSQLPSSTSSTSTTTTTPDDPDPFDTLLDLESTYEARGYTDGLHDGKAQALSSSTLFGIEKGFEKYIVISRLRFRAEKWALDFDVNHTTHLIPGSSDREIADTTPAAEGTAVGGGNANANARLQKHIATLLTLTSARTMDFANTDEAIGDFEERLKRALAKCKVIEKMVGTGDAGDAAATVGSGDIENPRLNSAALRKGVERDF